MDEHTKRIVEYIHQCQAQGIAQETIHATLLQHGWDAGAVNRAFSLTDPVQPTAFSSAPVPANPQPEQHNPVQPIHQKYGVFRAIGDALKAMRKNIATFVVTIVGGYVLLVLSVFVLLLPAYALVRTLHGAGLLVVVLVFMVWYAFANAFILAAPSLALYDGTNGHKGSIKQTFTTSFGRLTHVVLANALVSVVLFIPLLIPFLVMFALGVGSASHSVIIILVTIIAIIAMLILALRFTLVPYVALFEPTLPVRKALARSTQLLGGAGQWFIVKGVLLIFLFAILLGTLTGQSLQQLNSSENIAINLLLFLVSIFINGALTMLYLNRKAVKS